MLVFTMLFHGEDITKTRIILKHPRMYLNLSISLFVSEGEITSLCLVCSSFIGISSFLLKYYKNSSTTVASKDAFKQEYRFVSIWRKNNESFLPCLSFFLWDFLVSAEVLQKLEQAVASKNVFKQEYRLVSVWRSNELPGLFFFLSLGFPRVCWGIVKTRTSCSIHERKGRKYLHQFLPLGKWFTNFYLLL